MTSGFVYLRPVLLTFVRVRGPYATSSKQAWGQVFDWLDERCLRASVPNGFGLMHDNPKVVAADKCRYDACIAIPEGYERHLPDTFAVQTLPGGAYARKRHKGYVAEVSKTIAALRDTWVANHGLTLDSRRPMITIYYDDPLRVADGDRKFDICIPVAAKEEADMDRSAA